MAAVHFQVVLSMGFVDNSLLATGFEKLGGRPAMIFMLLAGIGVSLRVRPGASRSIEEVRKSLFRRGVFFFIVGYLNLIVWTGDILRVYGIAYIVASFVILSGTRRLLAGAIGAVAVFLVLVATIDFGTNIDFATLEYENLWTTQGALLNLFYNGFRSVFPWLGVFLLGMVIGRSNLQDPIVRRRYILGGLAAWAGAELVSFGLLQATLPLAESQADIDDLQALFGTDSFPSMPLFLISASGLATTIVMTCIGCCDAAKGKWFVPLANAGQLAFTWYIGHIVIVIAIAVATETQANYPTSVSLAVSIAFALLMVVTSWLYRKRFRFGPLEWVLRKLAK